MTVKEFQNKLDKYDENTELYFCFGNDFTDNTWTCEIESEELDTEFNELSFILVSQECESYQKHWREMVISDLYDVINSI